MKYHLRSASHYALLLVFMICGFVSAGQSLARQSINSSGASSKSNSVFIRQTVGQPYLAKRMQTGGLVLRQGFQQPSIFKLKEEERHNLDLTVFPNPATEILNFKSQEVLEKVSIRVVNLQGQIMWDKSFDQFDQHEIPCKNWPNGMYIVTLRDQQKVHYTSKLLINN